MARISLNQTRLAVALVVSSLFLANCTSSANSRFFGFTKPPSDNVVRYVTGSEPESLDPQVGTGQPEARIYLAIYDGLVEYHPKTMEPIPAIAESWEIGTDGTEYLFHLRKNARFSNGEPITARDFVYTFRRGLSPELASRNGILAYYIKYAEAYNSGQSFVKDANNQFLLKKDFAEPGPNKTAEPAPAVKPSADAPVTANAPAITTAASAQPDTFGGDSEFHRYLDSPERLYVPTDEKERAKVFEKNAKLKAAVEGKQLVAVKAEDIGVEAVDDYTVRVKLYQPAPFFLGLLAHQFFRVLPQKTIEKFGIRWSDPKNIVTSGAFKVSVHKPYDELVVVKDPNYWDAANVKLDGIEFYPLDEQTTMMNLYKSGRVDALYNHTVPGAWNETIRQFKDEYLLHPEVATEFYVFSVKKPPMDNVKVRQAFALAVDREALAEYRKTVKPLTDLTPEGIFPKYEEARKKIYAEKLKENNITPEEWTQRIFNPEKARKLLAESGFPVQQNGSTYACPSFPVDKVSITYNTAESNKSVAEFVQAQWKQNLGITVPLKNLEFRTYLPLLNTVGYDGFARRGWVGDYMDPFTFLGLYYTPANDGATGWWDPKYDKLLDEANNTVDTQKRFEKLAEAEFYVSQQQIIMPLSTQGTSWMKKPFVKGLYPNPGTLHAWKFVYIERDANKWDTNVDNIMKESDAAVDGQISQLTATQEQMEKSKSTENKAVE
jgi:oligopeptide transport system substrate-binding protein